MADTRMLRSVRLPIELDNGNTGRGSKWFSSAKVRKGIEQILRAHNYVYQPFNEPVVLRITRVVGPGQRLWDSDSIGRGNAKELIDAMVACGWFQDDGPKFIVETQFAQVVNRKIGPCVLVDVFEHERSLVAMDSAEH